MLNAKAKIIYVVEMTYLCVRNLQMFIQICNLVWGFSRSLPKFWNVCKSKGYEFEKGKQ